MARATPTYSGRINYNMVVCDINGDIIVGGQPVVGNYIRMKEFYSEIFIADTTNIFYETNGDTKVIAIDGLINIQNQQWMNRTDPDFLEDLFFETRLEDPCYTKALLYMDFVDGLFDSEGNQLYDSEGNKLYALKDGITYV